MTKYDESYFVNFQYNNLSYFVVLMTAQRVYTDIFGINTQVDCKCWKVAQVNGL